MSPDSHNLSTLFAYIKLVIANGKHQIVNSKKEDKPNKIDSNIHDLGCKLSCKVFTTNYYSIVYK